ncbi:putative nuclease HARBI1-like protein [Leptotrombidium deliense]|uniref:Putative nuclease HARBI1-like protein n=1 Tax=Leptotrombidium deliense TaxID=299467 RepID=A0A443RV80_9ACAR|nr:putative nuclease HARBI1-like protein [Leptotrombidium deliense]
MILAGKARDFISFPTPAECKQEQDSFFQIAGFPGIIGVIDCTHVEVKVPVELQERYRNRKNKISLNIQAIVGNDMRFTNFVARWPGSVHDARILRRSEINSKLDAGMYPGYLLGDAGYPCKRYLLTPLANPETMPEKKYQKKFVKSRLIVEQTFGCWKWKFYCLMKGLRTKLKNSINIIMACAVLWNFLVKQKEINRKERAHMVMEDLPALSQSNDLAGR